MIDFKYINFGYRSAETERQEKPTLLDEGFFKTDDSLTRLLEGGHFLVLGYKGSGKSAIGEHIDLISQTRNELFVEYVNLNDFPFDQVPEMVPGTISAESRTTLGWSLLLLLKLVESLIGDHGVIGQSRAELDDVARQLRALGLLPKRELKDLLLRSRERTVSAELPRVFKFDQKTTSEPMLRLSHVRDRLRTTIENALTHNRHFLIIDGLDEVFIGFESHYLVLASLIHEAGRINACLTKSNGCAKVVILCRTDIYERLPSPNIAKLRDHAVVLDWYQDPSSPLQSKLFSLATHRARLSGYQGDNVLADYLPKYLRYGGARSDTAKFLLDHTRHTPRDFLQLLLCLQKAVDVGSDLTRTSILHGLREYSLDYFLPEIKDELRGHFTPKGVEECIRIIGGLRKREFSLGELEGHAQTTGAGEDLDVRAAIGVLFDCSAIGNIVVRPRPRAGAGTYYTFKFRNRNASVNFAERLVLHRGLWKALNVA
jgi:hypothetical protein